MNGKVSHRKGNEEERMHTLFERVLQAERQRLQERGEKLVALAKIMKDSDVLTRVYDGFFRAYDAGLQSWKSLEADLERLSALMEGRKYEMPLKEEERMMLAGVPYEKQKSIHLLMACRRCALERPSDVFRNIFHQEMTGIIDALEMLARDDSLSAEAYHRNMVFLAELFCTFDLQETENEAVDPFWTSLVAAGIGFAVGSELEIKPVKELEGLFQSFLQ